MFCKTTYPKFEDIPEFARNDFEQAADSTWIMKQDAIEGAPAHFNAGLANNRDRALQQLKDANTARDAAQTRAQNAEAQLQQITGNGGMVLNAADSELWRKYTALGDLKTVETRLKEAETNAVKVSNFENEGKISQIAEKTGLNSAALKEWFEHPTRGAGYEPFYKENVPVEIEENGVKKTVNKTVAFVRKTQKINDVNTVTEHNLLEEAKTVLPDFQFAALTAANSNQTGNNGGNGANEANPFGAAFQNTAVQTQNNAQPTGGVILPMIGGNGGQPSGGGSNQSGGGQKSIADEFQAERDAKPSPFAPKKTA